MPGCVRPCGEEGQRVESKRARGWVSHCCVLCRWLTFVLLFALLSCFRSTELGHNMGLSHDGVKDPATGATTSGYYQGQGDWAPIMGVGYYKPTTQFSKGEYLNANQLQDDYNVISTKVPYIAQLHGSTVATAQAAQVTGVSGTTTTAQAVGIIR